MKTSDYPFEPSFPVSPITPNQLTSTGYSIESEINDTMRNAMDGSYKNGIHYGIMEAQVIMLQILNDNLFQITVDNLLKEFMKRTNEKLTK
jgi:hypothetical protein